MIFLILDLGTFTASPVFTVISLIQEKKTRIKTVGEHLDVVLKSFLSLEPGLDRHREISDRKHCPFEGATELRWARGAAGVQLMVGWRLSLWRTGEQEM